MLNWKQNVEQNKKHNEQPRLPLLPASWIQKHKTLNVFKYWNHSFKLSEINYTFAYFIVAKRTVSDQIQADRPIVEKRLVKKLASQQVNSSIAKIYLPVISFSICFVRFRSYLQRSVKCSFFHIYSNMRGDLVF